MKLLVNLIMLVVSIGVMYMLLGSVHNGIGQGYSSGDRVGSISKLSNKGMVCKTWEGTLAMSSFQQKNLGTSDKPNYVMTNAFDFSASDPAVIADLQKAMDSGASVKLHYEQWVVAPFCSQETNYTIVKVEFLK